MHTIADRKFSDETLEIDGKQFLRCHFTNVNLVYRGTDGTGFQECEFHTAPSIQFADAAERTFRVLQQFATRGSGFEPLIKLSFPTIFAN